MPRQPGIHNANRKYHWEEWFGRPRTVILRGRDYKCSQSAMWQQVKDKAHQLGIKVKVTDNNDSITIEVTAR